MKRLTILLLCCTFGMYINAQEKTLEPRVLLPVPDIDLVQCEKLVIAANDDYDNYEAMSQKEKDIIAIAEWDEVLMHFYSPACSWYCGGQIDTVTASSSLSEKYLAENAHDFSIITAWVEGKEDNEEGEYLLYSFPGTCPRITGVMILNGYTKNEEVWRNNGRVAKLLMYYNDEPYATLNLKDTRDCQIFDVGTLGYEDKSNAPAWTIKFEILEVYPGDKYQDTAITEIYFDGIDVH